MGRVVLITGGARSGKSAYALKRVADSPAKAFIATALALDPEMADRIARHRQERGPGWITIEEPYDLPDALEKVPAGSAAIVDCLTVWLGNLFHRHDSADEPIATAIDRLAVSVQRCRQTAAGELLLVTNEVGWGIVPADASTRAFRDHAGRLNQRIAHAADEVYLCVSGIAVKIKPPTD